MGTGRLARSEVPGPDAHEPARPSARRPTPAAATVVALTAAAAVLRFYGLAHQGFWFDEANTALLVRFSPGKMLGLIPQTESTPPLYYCVAWVWARIFGDTEAGLRSLSAVAGVAVVPVAYAAARQLISRRAGLIVCALTAFNPLLIWYSQEARSYELLVLLCAVALLAFCRASAAPDPRRLGVWVIACALALATHYYAVVEVAPQAAWLLYEHRRRLDVRIAVGVVALCGLALVPLALSQNATGNDSWIAHSPLDLRLAQITPQLLIGTGAPDRQALKYLAFALALCGFGLLAVRSASPLRRPALIAGGLALGGFVLSLGFIAAGSDALITRNIIGLWLPAAMALGAGLAVTGPRAGRLGLVVTVGLCAIGLTAAVGVAADRDLQRPDWRPVARLLGPAPPRGGARLILVQHYRTLLPLSLYMADLRVLRARAARGITQIDLISISSPQQPLCWWGAACNLIPSRMQARYPIPGFHELWRRRVLQFTVMRLVSRGRERVSRAEVAAALTATSLPRDDLLIQRP